MAENVAGKVLSIGEVAAKTGVSRRTVRFYVQQGLISPPEGRGRGSVYTADHVQQIVRIRQLQRDGIELNTIRELGAAGSLVTGGTSASRKFPARSIVRIELAPGIRLELDAGEALPAQPLLQAMREACQQILGDSPRGP